MDAKAKTLEEILFSPDQYLIPFFQRQYSWQRKHWKTLWDDIMNLLEEESVKRAHFLGPLVCTPTAKFPGDIAGYQLIDGQQRLTTLTVLLVALRDLAREREAADLSAEIEETYLIHKFKDGLQRYKVIPRIGDREVLISLIQPTETGELDASSGIVGAYRFFRRSIEHLGAGADDLRRLLTAVTRRLSLVVITVDGENPYEIFESLNSTGLPLEEADLIRNHIFMEVPLSEQEAFNEAHWVRFESMFDQVGEQPALSATDFYRNYVMRDGAYSRRNAIYVDFKEQARASEQTPAALAAELKRWARHELMLRRPSGIQDLELREALRRIDLLDIKTAYPLIMHLLDRHERGILDRAELLGCLADLESFVLRRSICGESTRAYGRWFAGAIREISLSPRADLRGYWAGRGWPADSLFKDRLVSFQLYRREYQKTRLILETLESSDHKEPVNLELLTVEHVLPQTVGDDQYGATWKAALGPEWQRVHETVCHTLGNLTLTGYNPELSNRDFEWKKEQFAKSNLRMNKDLAALSTWDETAIRARAALLAQEVVDLWPRPRGLPSTPAADAHAEIGINVHALYLDFWTQFCRFMEDRAGPIRMRKPGAQYWTDVAVGRTEFSLALYAIHRADLAGVYLWIGGPQAKARFAALHRDRERIEAALGFGPLDWKELPENIGSQVVRRRPSRVADRSTWPELSEWLAETVEAMDRVFRPLVREL